MQPDETPPRLRQVPLGVRCERVAAVAPIDRVRGGWRSACRAAACANGRACGRRPVATHGRPTSSCGERDAGVVMTSSVVHAMRALHVRSHARCGTNSGSRSCRRPRAVCSRSAGTWPSIQRASASAVASSLASPWRDPQRDAVRQSARDDRCCRPDVGMPSGDCGLTVEVRTG